MFSSSTEQKAVRSSAQNCAHIKKLGYIAGKHVSLYGEHMELVSDPFEMGDLVAVRVISSSNPVVQTIDLPVSILAGWEDVFEEAARHRASELIAKPPASTTNG